jgi:rSAM/selenodomain-associated transferase 1
VEQKACVVIFVRSPDKGTVKTRLTAVLDEDTALDLYRRFVLDLLRTVSHGNFGLRICFYPAESGKKLADWLGREYVYIAQQGKDLGERMENAFLAAFAEGFQRVALVGSDIPDLSGEIFEEAINALASKDAVIGPAIDGGYYLIGFNSDRFLTEVIKNIDWGTPSVFQRTMSMLHRNRYEVGVLPRWRDIDTYDDLIAFMRNHELTRAGQLLTLDYLRARGTMRDDEPL